MAGRGSALCLGQAGQLFRGSHSLGQGCNLTQASTSSTCPAPFICPRFISPEASSVNLHKHSLRLRPCPQELNLRQPVMSDPFRKAKGFPSPLPPTPRRSLLPSQLPESSPHHQQDHGSNEEAWNGCQGPCLSHTLIYPPGANAKVGREHGSGLADLPGVAFCMF